MEVRDNGAPQSLQTVPPTASLPNPERLKNKTEARAREETPRGKESLQAYFPPWPMHTHGPRPACVHSSRFGPGETTDKPHKEEREVMEKLIYLVAAALPIGILIYWAGNILNQFAALFSAIRWMEEPPPMEKIISQMLENAYRQGYMEGRKTLLTNPNPWTWKEIRTAALTFLAPLVIVALTLLITL